MCETQKGTRASGDGGGGGGVWARNGDGQSFRGHVLYKLQYKSGGGGGRKEEMCARACLSSHYVLTLRTVVTGTCTLTAADSRSYYCKIKAARRSDYCAVPGYLPHLLSVPFDVGVRDKPRMYCMYVLYLGM
jgi:hypothetical protein